MSSGGFLLLTLILETMSKEKTELQEPTNPPLLIADVGRSTSTKELLECTVCWGGGKIEIDDFGNEEDCTWCNGTGFVREIEKAKQLLKDTETLSDEEIVKNRKEETQMKKKRK